MRKSAILKAPNLLTLRPSKSLPPRRRGVLRSRSRAAWFEGHEEAGEPPELKMPAKAGIFYCGD